MLLQRRTLAQQAQHFETSGFDAGFLMPQSPLQTLPGGVGFGHHRAGAGNFLIQLRDRRFMPRSFGVQRGGASVELDRFALALDHALFDGAAFPHLRGEGAARPFGFKLRLSQAAAFRRQLRVGFVANVLQAAALAIVALGFFGQAAQLGGSQVQIERGFGGFPLQQSETRSQHDAQLAVQLGFELAIAARLGRLPLERIYLPRDFFQDVENPRQILAGAFQLGFRQALAGLEAGDAGGFFDDGAPVLRLGTQNLPDAPLLDNGVAFRAQAGAHEQVLNVAQAGNVAVDQVFALAGSIQAARDGHFAGLVGDRGGAVAVGGMRRGFARGRIHQRHRDRSHAERLAIPRARKNHIFHASAAQTFGGLFAEHPTNGVAQIGFSTAVRTHNRGDAAAIEFEFRTLAKRFKTLEFDAFQS